MNKRTSTLAAVVAMTGALLIALHIGGANAAPPRGIEITATITGTPEPTPFVPPIEHPPCYGCMTNTPASTRVKPMFEGGPMMYMPVLMLGE